MNIGKCYNNIQSTKSYWVNVSTIYTSVRGRPLGRAPAVPWAGMTQPGNAPLIYTTCDWNWEWELHTHAAHSSCAVATCVTWVSIRVKSNIKRTSHVFAINTLSYINIYIEIIYCVSKAARTIWHIQIPLIAST